MAWLEITIDTEPGRVESVASALTAGGFPELVIEDQEEFETFLDENRAYWDYIDEDFQKKLQGLSHIKLYLEDTDKDGLSRLEVLVAQLGLPMNVAAMADVDWEESWKDNYPAVEVGKNLIVLPYWQADSDTSGRTPIILDPGLTFGTGAHPSTQMVMEAMEETVTEGFKCLDLGSGSGILSIAALRLGAKSAIGIDIDPKAEGIARENAAYNDFRAPEFTALTGNVTADKKLMEQLSRDEYDLVLVNIVADVIIGLAPVLPNFLTEKSTLICSGILDVRLKDVTAALEAAGLAITSVRAKEDWRCVTAKRSTT
ncbi:MAG: 50S ribosomal protein L11 methyltransferase [Oscillospiraceae bacterium]|nr:50S ribosomal protein L11 methyltransferase [Oscillospiraceae bacterium]